MRLGLSLGYAASGTAPADLVELARRAEALGYDSAWVSEAWGSDAVSVLAYLAAVTTRIRLGSAVLQMPARTPACTAMTAATLDLLSSGRLLLGLGTSGPQVVEGWHGQPWGKPLARAREYVEVVRAALRRETVQLQGSQLRLPYDGPGATGLGKPLKLMLRPLRDEVPIYLAALGPRHVELAFEIADGWLPLFFSPERARKVFDFVPRPGFDIAASVPLVLTDDLEAGRDSLRPMLALYVGGMGARGRNFYNDLVRRYGYEDAAARIQDLYLDDKPREAAAAVPDALVDEVALVGPRARIAERLAAWRESGADTLLVQSRDPAALAVMAELVS
jgi:F420-dependent oxidoreductase-like protein